MREKMERKKIKSKGETDRQRRQYEVGRIMMGGRERKRE
jgi:hypothetical protein